MVKRINLVLEYIKPFFLKQAIGNEGPDLHWQSRERTRRIFLTAIVSISAKFISMITLFLTIPMTLHYLGSEEFGLWMTLSSVIVMLSFADMGIGNGVLNKISNIANDNDGKEISKIICSSLFILFLIAVMINVVFFPFYKIVNWNAALNISDKHRDIADVMFVFVFCFSLNIVSSIVQKIELGFQMGFLSGVWQIIASLLSLVFLFLFIYMKLSLSWLIFAFVGVPALVQFVNLFVFVFCVKKNIVINFKLITKNEIISLLSVGGLFFILQLSMAMTYTSDNLIINSFIGPAAVAEYAIHVRLFSVIPILLGIVMIPLWPAYSSARVSGDRLWIRKTLGKSICMSLSIAILLGGGILIFIRPIFGVWLGPQSHPIYLLASLLFLWKILEALGLAVSCFLNGMHIIRSQAIIGVLTAIVALAFKIFLIQYIGVIGVVVGTLCAYLFLTFIPTLFIVLNYFKTNHEVI